MFAFFVDISYAGDVPGDPLLCKAKNQKKLEGSAYIELNPICRECAEQEYKECEYKECEYKEYKECEPGIQGMHSLYAHSLFLCKLVVLGVNYHANAFFVSLYAYSLYSLFVCTFIPAFFGRNRRIDRFRVHPQQSNY